MKALYARDTSGTMDGIAETYDQTTPGSAADTSGRPANCNWARVSAVSLALVARSSQYDKAVVTSSAPSWSVAIDLTKNPDGSANANWQHYRYKLFQAIAPIRNVAWMGVPSGC
jgi:type IV pilus assembly protein PilW